MFGLNNAANEAAEVLGKSRESSARASYNKEFNTGNFDSFGGDSQPNGKFTETASFKVPAGTEYAWGYGSAGNPDNQGYLYVDLQNSNPNPIEGTIQFVQESATGRQSRVVAEFDTTRLDGSKTDKQQMVPFPEQVNHPRVGQDSYLTVFLDPDATDTVNKSESTIVIPVTEYDLSQ